MLSSSSSRSLSGVKKSMPMGSVPGSTQDSQLEGRYPAGRSMRYPRAVFEKVVGEATAVAPGAGEVAALEAGTSRDGGAVVLCGAAGVTQAATKPVARTRRSSRPLLSRLERATTHQSIALRLGRQSLSTPPLAARPRMRGPRRRRAAEGVVVTSLVIHRPLMRSQPADTRSRLLRHADRAKRPEAREAALCRSGRSGPRLWNGATRTFPAP